MGMKFTINVLYKDDVLIDVKDIDFMSDLPNKDSIDAVASRVRVFALRNENLYWKKIIESLKRKDKIGRGRNQVEFLASLFDAVPFSRMKFSKVDIETNEELIPRWVDNVYIGDRYAYSEVFHADDEIDLLNEFNYDEDIFSYASLVGDMVAMTAALESCIQLVCPEKCQELTSWAGSPMTINYRSGVDRYLDN